MWPEIYKFAITTVAVLFCGAAIKLIDDYLDQEEDQSVGRWNWTDHFGAGTPVYAMFLLATAAALNTVVSLSLFFSSYAVGMFTFPERSYRSGLRGWQECLLSLLIGISMLGWNNMAVALILIISVQLTDDCFDRQSDSIHKPPKRNWATQLGTLECILIMFILLLTAFKFASDSFFPTLTAIIILCLLSYWHERRSLS